MRHRRFRRHRIQQRAPQVSVFQHMPHGAFLDLGTVKVQTQKHLRVTRTTVTDLDLVHWLRVALQPVPQPQRRQHPHGSQGQGVRTPVEIVATPRACCACIHHSARQTGPRRRQSQHRPVQAAANNQQIRGMCHDREYGSRAGIVHALLCRYRRADQGESVNDQLAHHDSRRPGARHRRG